MVGEVMEVSHLGSHVSELEAVLVTVHIRSQEREGKDGKRRLEWEIVVSMLYSLYIILWCLERMEQRKKK